MVCFSGGLDSPGVKVGLDNLKGLSNLGDSMSLCLQ